MRASDCACCFVGAKREISDVPGDGLGRAFTRTEVLLGKQFTLTSADKFQLGAYRADPSGPAKGGIVVIQEIFGVNHHIRAVCDRLAGEGYAAVAPAVDPFPITTSPIREQHSAAMVVCRGAFAQSATEFPTREMAGVRSSLPGRTLCLRLAAADRKHLPCADACSSLHAAGSRSCPHTEPFSAFSAGARDCHETVGDHGRAPRQS